MKQLKLIALLISIIVILLSCDVLIFRDIECREFKLTNEYYWSPADIADSVVFINSANQRMKFVIVDKRIIHRTKYVSDTGCGCLDVSQMLMTNGIDSIWFKNETRYVEDNNGNVYEDLVLVLDNNMTIFFETDIAQAQSFTIDNMTFSDIKKFNNDGTEGTNVKTVCLAKYLGIIRFEMQDGEIWTNENLTKLDTTSVGSFIYDENTCE